MRRAIALLALLASAGTGSAQVFTNATKLRNKPLCNPFAPAPDQALVWSASNGCWGPAGIAAGAVGWGSITGTLASQSDVATALALRAPIANPTFTGTVGGITAAMVGLGNLLNVAQEPALGNPGTNGYVLASTTGGTRSWVAPGGGSLSGGTNTQFAYWTGSGTLGAHPYMLYDATVDSPVFKHAAGGKFYVTHSGSSPATGRYVFDDSGNAAGTTVIDFISGSGNHLTFSDGGPGWTWPIGFPAPIVYQLLAGYEAGAENASAALADADLTSHAIAVNGGLSRTISEATCISDAGSQSVTVKTGATTVLTITCVPPGSYSRSTTTGTTGFLNAAHVTTITVAAGAMLDLSGTANATTKDIKLFIYAY